MDKKTTSLGTLLLQIALGILFVVNGIFILRGFSGDEISQAIYSIMGRDFAKILCIIFGIIELIAGVFLILKIFICMNNNFDSILMTIIMIAWIVAIVIVDFIGKYGISHYISNGNFLGFLNIFGRHLLTLGAIIKIRD